MTRLFTHSFTAVGLALGLLACSTEPPQTPVGAELPDPGPDGTYRVEFPEPAEPEVRHLLMTVSEDVTKRCNLTPHFPFDDAEPLAQGRIKLAFVAQCLKSNQLDGHDVFLVGHADSRGSDEYNLELALERAKEVKKMLVEDGVAPERLNLGTAGETFALGGTDDLHSYGYDRRVDVMILGQNAKPEASGVIPYIPLEKDTGG